MSNEQCAMNHEQRAMSNVQWVKILLTRPPNLTTTTTVYLPPRTVVLGAAKDAQGGGVRAQVQRTHWGPRLLLGTIETGRVQLVARATGRVLRAVT